MDDYRHISDADLCAGIKKDEKYAFRELYNRYAPRIYQFSFHYLKSKYDSEELVQIVFIKIWQNRYKLDSGQNIKSYLYKVAVNTMYDFIRHKNVKQAFENFSKLHNTVDNNTWNTVIYDDMKEIIYEMARQLPEKQQRIFILSKIEGFSNEEIAKKLNLSKRTVENHLYRAIHFFKQHLGKESFLVLLFFCLM